MQEDCEAPSLTCHQVAESRLLAHICLHHGFYHLLVFCFDYESFESLFTEIDRFKVIHLDQRYRGRSDNSSIQAFVATYPISCLVENKPQAQDSTLRVYPPVVGYSHQQDQPPYRGTHTLATGWAI